MLKHLRLYIIVTGICAFYPMTAYGENMQAHLEDMLYAGHSEQVFKKYLSPLSVALGLNMSTTCATSAAARTLPHFEVSLNMISTSVPGKEAFFLNEEGKKYPTVFGPTDVNGTDIQGIRSGKLEFPSIQFNMGLFASLELVFRYTNWDIDQIGALELRGLGIKYELIEIPVGIDKPLYLSLMANYQNLQLESFIESAAFGMTINVSKSFSFLPLELIGGVRYANNILTFDSNKLMENSGIGSVNIDGINGLFYQIGLGYRVAFIRAFADYNIGQYNSFSAGVGIGF